jgi:hypothetical protein
MTVDTARLEACATSCPMMVLKRADRIGTLREGLGEREKWRLRTGRKPGQTALSTRRREAGMVSREQWRLGTGWSVPVFARLFAKGRPA